MKAIACILLLGYWIFGAAPSEDEGQDTPIAEEMSNFTTQNQSATLPEASTTEVIFLDANRNIVKSNSDKFVKQEEGF